MKNINLLKISKLMTPNKKFGIFMGELLGTATLLYIGCFAVAIQIFDSENFPPYFSGVVFGLTVMIIIQMFGHISGAHLNPSVTIAAVLVGQIKPILVPIYFVAQFAGAFLGFYVLQACLPLLFTNPELFDPSNSTRTSGVCCTVPHEKITELQALYIETIATAVLILLCLAVWDKRNAQSLDSVGLRFGFAVACLSITFGGLTGCSMNTARTLAPAVINWEWNGHWIYWIGPNAGTLIAVIFYKAFLSEQNTIDPSELQHVILGITKTKPQSNM